MLLQEYIPFKVDRQLAEAAIRDNKTLIVEGVIQRAEAPNQNERVNYLNSLVGTAMRKPIKGFGK